MPSTSANSAGASSGVASIIFLRLPPAKNVFLALVSTTPVTESFSATSRSTAALIESR